MDPSKVTYYCFLSQQEPLLTDQLKSNQSQVQKIEEDKRLNAEQYEKNQINNEISHRKDHHSSDPNSSTSEDD